MDERVTLPDNEPLKDPKGGLTAAGRKMFAARDGANLKPGVKDYEKASLADKKRWISWALRFYGQKSYPPLKKPNGEPTRFALTAAAWGEPVPETEADARKIEAKARRRQAEVQRMEEVKKWPYGSDADGDGVPHERENRGKGAGTTKGIKTSVTIPAGTTLTHMTHGYNVDSIHANGLRPSKAGESGPGVYLTHGEPYKTSGTVRMEFQTTRPLKMLDRTNPNGEAEYRRIAGPNKQAEGYDGVIYGGVGGKHPEIVVYDPSHLVHRSTRKGKFKRVSAGYYELVVGPDELYDRYQVSQMESGDWLLVYPGRGNNADVFRTMKEAKNAAMYDMDDDVSKRRRGGGRPGPNPKSSAKEIAGKHGHRPHTTSILWPALYEHLRAKGHSKAAAAAISNGQWNKKHGRQAKNLKSTRVTKNYTEPALRERLKAEIMAGDKGGKPGQWSARKAQLLAQQYEAKGGGYTGKKTKSQSNLSRWTEQKWTTSSGKPSEGKRRYLPAEAWDDLTDEQIKATNAKKAKGNRRGKQFVPNTEAAASAGKEARVRKSTATTLLDVVELSKKLPVVGEKITSRAKRMEMAAEGSALPDGSFPIASVNDLVRAVRAYGRASDPKAAKAHIILMAKKFGRVDLLPEDWQSKILKTAPDSKDVYVLGSMGRKPKRKRKSNREIRAEMRSKR